MTLVAAHGQNKGVLVAIGIDMRGRSDARADEEDIRLEQCTRRTGGELGKAALQLFELIGGWL